MTTLRTVREHDDGYRALFDPITGLPKRSLLRDRLAVALARAGRDNRFVGLLSVSVAFEPLRSNQATVHALREISIRLTSLLRPDDTAARVEDACAFIVVCNNLTAADQLDAIAQRLTSALAATLPFDLESVAVQATINCTLAVPSDNPEQLLDDVARDALTH
jgi:GGDEF domain-containing protein